MRLRRGGHETRREVAFHQSFSGQSEMGTVFLRVFESSWFNTEVWAGGGTGTELSAIAVARPGRGGVTLSFSQDMAAHQRSLGLAALGWWLTSRGLGEPIEESFTRLEAVGVQKLGKASRTAALVATRRLAEAIHSEAGAPGVQPELFSGAAAGPSWLQRLETLLDTPRIGLKLEKALSGDSEDFAALIEVDLEEDRSVMLAARLAGWIESQIGSQDEPPAMARFLAQGWPIAAGSDRYVTFQQEFLANFLTELADAPREITIPLGEPVEFLEWLEKESAGKLVKSTPLPPPVVDPAIDAAPLAVEAEIPARPEVVEEKLASEPEEEPMAEATAEPEAATPETEATKESEAEAEPAAEPSIPSVEEPTPPPHDERRADPAEAENDKPVVATSSPVQAPPAPSESPTTEHATPRRGAPTGLYAFLFQIGWVALVVFGWKAVSSRHSRLTAQASPAPVAVPAATEGGQQQTTSPAPTPSTRTPVVTATTPKPPADAGQPTPATDTLPQKPEMSVLPDQLESQAKALAAAGHHAEAVAMYRRISQIQAQDRMMGRLPRALNFARMAASMAALERWDEADAVVERAQALLEELLPTHDMDTALGLEMVADYWASRERWPLAARLYQKAVQTYEGTKAENSSEEMSAINRLAGALRQIGDVKTSEKLYRQLLKGYEGAGNIVALDAASAAHNLANVLVTTNRAGEAREYYEQALTWIAKAPPGNPEAERMLVIMTSNYEHCLQAMGVPENEAEAKARKPLPRATPGKGTPRSR